MPLYSTSQAQTPSRQTLVITGINLLLTRSMRSLWQSCRLSCALPDIQRCIWLQQAPVDAVHASRLSTINGLDISIDLLPLVPLALIQLHLEGKRQAQTWFLCVLASCLLPASKPCDQRDSARSHDLLQILLHDLSLF